MSVRLAKKALEGFTKKKPEQNQTSLQRTVTAACSCTIFAFYMGMGLLATNPPPPPPSDDPDNEDDDACTRKALLDVF